MNILDNIELGTIRTTRLKTGEIIVGVTYNLDDDSIYIDFPHQIEYFNDEEFYLQPFLMFTEASGFVLDFKDLYFTENSSAYMSTLYLKYLDNKNKED